MVSHMNWSRIGEIAQQAASAIGQTVLRYQRRIAEDEVRFYFGSGWYANIDGDAVAEYERDDGEPLRALMDREFRAQYERHGKPIAPEQKTRCPLCGKESDQAPMLLYGMKVVGCSCVETFAGGRYDGVMIDEKAEYKQRAIEMLNDAMRDGHEAIKRSGKRWSECWSDAPLPDDDWSKAASKERDRVKQVRAERRRALQLDGLVDRLAKRGHESEFNPVAVRMGYPAKSLVLTDDDEAQARAEWSRRLRELQAEARRKEREQVVIDIDWE